MLCAMCPTLKFTLSHGSRPVFIFTIYYTLDNYTLPHGRPVVNGRFVTWEKCLVLCPWVWHSLCRVLFSLSDAEEHHTLFLSEFIELKADYCVLLSNSINF